MKKAERSVRATLLALGLLGCTGVAAAAGGCGTLTNDCDEELTCLTLNAGGESNGTCLGTCLPGWTSEFEEPVLVWMGAPKDKPEKCPLPATNEYWSGYADLKPDDFRCDDCACSAPACALPVSITAHSGFMCPGGPGDVLTPIEPPAGWDGSCVSPGTVSPALFGSYEIPPATEVPCVPLVEQVPVNFETDSPWERAALACQTRLDPKSCPSDAAARWATCMMNVDESTLPPGWDLCIVSDDNDATVACPEGWPVRSVFYAELQDTRGCTECTCTPTATSTCKPLVSTYEDLTCRELIASIVLGNDAGCVDPSTSTELGSLSATWLVNEPGSCEASPRDRFGELTPGKPKTLCCRGEHP